MKTVRKNNLWLPALFDDLFLDNRLDVMNNYETFNVPALNIIENSTTFVIEIAAPGFDKKDFEIEVQEDMLKISSKKTVETEEKNDGSRYIKREFNYRKFEQSFKLPKEVRKDEILANYESGVLKITLPKMEQENAFKKMVEIS